MMSDNHEQGICPKCGSDGLTYGDTKKQDIVIGYEYICEGCGFTGIEWYNLHFTEHTNPDCTVAKPCDKCRGTGWIEEVRNSSYNTIELQRCDLCKKYATDGEAAQAAVKAARQKSAKVIIFVSGGQVQSISTDNYSISVDVADKDNVNAGEDATEYNRLTALAETDEYKQIY